MSNNILQHKSLNNLLKYWIFLKFPVGSGVTKLLPFGAYSKCQNVYLITLNKGKFSSAGPVFQPEGTEV